MSVLKIDSNGAEGEIRTHTGFNSQWFLRPPRLPFRHFGTLWVWGEITIKRNVVSDYHRLGMGGQSI